MPEEDIRFWKAIYDTKIFEADKRFGSFVEQLKNFLTEKDIVMGISGSGNSKNVIKAIEYANGRGATSLSLTGFDGGKIANICDKAIVVPVDDMQKAEDLHLMIAHIIMQVLSRKLQEKLVASGK